MSFLIPRGFPRSVWMVVLVMFLATAGYSAFWPFITIWATHHLHASSTQIGLILLGGAGVGVVGSVLGGWAADRIGRRPVVVAGFALGAVRMAGLTQVDSLAGAVVVLLIGDFVVNATEPGIGALIADLVPEERLGEGYALRRAAGNAGWAIGPGVGGFAATQSYTLLFLWASLCLAGAAVLAFALLPPGNGAGPVGVQRPSPRIALADRSFMAVVAGSLACMLLLGVFETVVPKYLSEERGIGTDVWGALLILNAFVVLFTQMPIARRLSRLPPSRVLALGALLFGGGLATFASRAPLAVLALAGVIVTAGIMLVLPAASAVAARIAPDHLQGTYQGVSGMTISITFGVGPMLGLWMYQHVGRSSPLVFAPVFAIFAALSIVAALRPYERRWRSSSAIAHNS